MSIAQIDLVVDNHRQAMDPAKLDQLAASMKETGLLSPIATVKQGRRHALIFGHRRLEAAKMLGWKQIRSDVHTGLTDLEIAEMQAIENLQREDLTPMDEAHAVKALLDAGYPTELIASRIDRSPDFVRSRLDLLRLDKKLHPFVASGRLPIKHAGLIARVGDKHVQLQVAMEAMGQGYYAGALEKCHKTDYVTPLATARQQITVRMQTLGACRWPMDKRYAGKRSCQGCADNSATQPGLFDGITLPGKSPRGNCTNKACFQAKAGAWARDPEKKRRDRERAAQAKAAGKPPPARPASADKPRRKFPDTPADHLALALWDYGQMLIEAIGGRLADKPKPPREATAITLKLAASDLPFWEFPEELETPMAQLVEEVRADAPFPDPPVGTIFQHLLTAAWRTFQPVLNTWSVKPEGVPLSDGGVVVLAFLEALAGRWAVELKTERPKEDDFKSAAVKAPTPGTCRICGCTEDHACAGGCAWLDDSRTLCDNPDCLKEARSEYPDWPAIATGKKPAALKSLAACQNVQVLAILQTSGLTGDWRRAAVAKRIKQLGAA